LSDYFITIATLAVIYSVTALALNVRWGWAGEFDFFVYGLLAVGGYVYAVMVLPPAPKNDPGLIYFLGLKAPFIVGAIAAMGATGVISLIVGVIALRELRQVFFGIMTFSSVLIMAAVVGQETPLFNGYNGVFGVPQPFYSSLHLQDQTYAYFFLGLCVVILIAVYLLLERIFWSPFGLALRAIREDEIAAAAFGHSPFAARLKAYVVGGMIAGLSGALLVSYLTAFNTDAWSPIETVLIFAAIIIGGTGNGKGAILGSFIVFGVILEGTRYLPPIPGNPNTPGAARAIAIALVTLIFLRWRPEGILPERHLRDLAPGGHLQQLTSLWSRRGSETES
jgi:ABC-type branched-subunit amino acid transport system permease subunit